MEDLKGKTAFITGGASGLGLGIAKACAGEGMNVIIADMRKNAIDEVLPIFKENNWPVLGLQLNVTDREAFAKAADEAEAAFGKIHLLVNNAGIGSLIETPLWEVSYIDTDLMININLTGVLNGVRIILPRIIKHGEGGHVVSTASMAGLIPTPGFGLYNVTKAAVIAMMETLSEDLMGSNIGASSFCPGPHATTFGKSTAEIRSVLAGEALDLSQEPERIIPDRTPEEAGKRVIRGVKRGDLYILTHVECRNGFKERADAIVKAFPDEVFDADFYKNFSLVCENPVFGKQTQVPAFK
jgi:NAD(P)-dependent dehydrogenase (short-subunit alcohol dehydrogenase family)